MEGFADLIVRAADRVASEAVLEAKSDGGTEDDVLVRLRALSAEAVSGISQSAYASYAERRVPQSDDPPVTMVADKAAELSDWRLSDALRLLKSVRAAVERVARDAPNDAKLPRSAPAFVGVFFDAVELTSVHRWESGVARPQAAEGCDFYVSLFDDLPVPVWRTDTTGALAYANRAWLTFTGRTLPDERGEGWLAGVAPEDRASLHEMLVAAHRRVQPFRFEYYLRRHDGESRRVETQAAPVKGADGVLDGFVGWTTDITEHRQQAAQLAFMATHDPLTGLPNRRMLEEPLKRAVARARRGTPSALLVLDLDNFKYYNDALGHIEGDQALINLSLLLQTHLRAGDLLVRMGGDEFAVLLEGAGPDEALDIAERMRGTGAGEFAPRARDFGLSISAGLLMIDGGSDYRRLLAYADSAMYKAKESGRNRVMLYTQRDDTETTPGTLANRLREALRGDGLVLHYQPVVRLADGDVVYHEALVRLLPDVAGGALLSPSEFLPSVQRFGLMPKLTRWVVACAIRELAEGTMQRVSVNLSALDFADDRLPRDIAAMLGQAGVDPHRLMFEASERAVSQDLALAEGLLCALGSLGCRMVLEDFGHAFSSLGMLRGLPVDQVKVSGNLLTALGDEPSKVALMSAVRTLAAGQGKRAVADCVETAEQLEAMRSAGFEFAQGFFLGRPTPRPTLAARVGA